MGGSREVLEYPTVDNIARYFADKRIPFQNEFCQLKLDTLAVNELVTGSVGDFKLTAAGVLCFVYGFLGDNLLSVAEVAPKSYGLWDKEIVDWGTASFFEKLQYVLSLDEKQRAAFVAFSVGVPHEMLGMFCESLGIPPSGVCLSHQWWFFRSTSERAHLELHHLCPNSGVCNKSLE